MFTSCKMKFSTKKFQINPLTQADQLTPETARQIDEVFENFEIEVKPYIQRSLFDVNNLRTTVPVEINSCVDSALSAFGDLAIPIIDAVQAC